MPHDQWEVWLDTQISPIIAKWMSERTGMSVRSSYVLGTNNSSDLQIYQQAKAAGNIILISKDADFPELITRLGAPPKLIVIKKGNCDNRTLWEHLEPHIGKAIDLLINSSIDIVEII